MEASVELIGVKRGGRNYSTEENQMATPKINTKSSAKSAPVKSAAPAKPATTVKAKAPPRKTGKVEPAAKPLVVKAPVKKAAPKAGAAKPVAARAKKPRTVPPEQRRNYIEMAAYYIAERRGFVPGNPLEDWVQAEAEIDRLLAEGLLGG